MNIITSVLAAVIVRPVETSIQECERGLVKTLAFDHQESKLITGNVDPLPTPKSEKEGSVSANSHPIKKKSFSPYQGGRSTLNCVEIDANDSNCGL